MSEPLNSTGAFSSDPEDDDSYGPAPPPPSRPHPEDTPGSRTARLSRRDASPEGEKFRDDYDAESGASAGAMYDAKQPLGDDPPQEQAVDYSDDMIPMEGEEEEYYGEDETVEIPPTKVVQRMLAEDEVDKTESNRCLYLAGVVGCCVIIAGVILGVGFGTGAFTTNVAGSTEGSDRGVPAGSDPTTPTEGGGGGGGHTIGDTTPVPDNEAVVSFLTGISNEGEATFADTNSHSSLAMEEILREDALVLNPAFPADQFRLTQRFSLLSLWYSSFDAWEDETGWTEPIHECEWYGVICETMAVEGVPEEQLVVTEINMFRNNLQGPLPADLALLSQLRDLNMGYNQIMSPLPTTLWSMSSLERLFLNNNRLSEELPTDFSKLTSLQHFDAANNRLEGDLSIFYTLPNDKMEYLVLDNNKFTGTFEGISSLKELTRFTIGDNEITGEILPEFGDMPKLEYLWVYNNELTGQVPQELSQLDNLIAFDAVGNDLTGGLSTVLVNNPNLQVLQLGDNPNLGGEIPVEYGDFAGDLIWLNIENCGLSGDIPDFLANNERLQVLRLGDNAFNQNPIPAFIYNMTDLVDLRLHKSNRNSGIDENIGNLVNLRVFKLEENFLAGAIPPTIANTNLTVFTAFDQFLSGNIPAELETLTDLEELDLHKNELDGPLPDFGVFPDLKTVKLEDNALTGELGEGITGARRLEYLDLSNNGLWGNLPSDWSAMRRMQQIHLNGNEFTGRIPSSFQALRGLVVLQLANNNFRGSLPDIFAPLVGLMAVRLENNNLSGPIPPSIGNLMNLQILTCNNNVDADSGEGGIEGPLPLTLGNLGRIEVFECRNNIIDGSLPEQMAGMRSLKRLDLRSNWLDGVIPQSLSSLPNLERFLVSDNYLEGPWPEELCQASMPSVEVMVADCSVECPEGCCTDCEENQFN